LGIKSFGDLIQLPVHRRHPGPNREAHLRYYCHLSTVALHDPSLQCTSSVHPVYIQCTSSVHPVYILYIQCTSSVHLVFRANKEEYQTGLIRTGVIYDPPSCDQKIRFRPDTTLGLVGGKVGKRTTVVQRVVDLTLCARNK
jgi:hypothetical protein